MNPTAYFECQFRLSNRVVEYERVIYSFFEMAGDIGGFGEAVYIVCLLFVSAYANRMFFASMIQEMFKVRLDTHGALIQDLAMSKTNVIKRRSQLQKRKTADAVMLDNFALRYSLTKPIEYSDSLSSPTIKNQGQEEQQE